MDGIDISKKNIPQFTPLNISFNKELYIKDSTRRNSGSKDLYIGGIRWPSVLNYVWGNLLCYDTQKSIIRNWKSGFPIYKQNFSYDSKNKKYYLESKSTGKEIVVGNKTIRPGEISSMKFQISNIEETIAGLKILDKLMTGWGDISKTSTDLYNMKTNLETFLKISPDVEKFKKLQQQRLDAIDKILKKKAIVNQSSNDPQVRTPAYKYRKIKAAAAKVIASQKLTPRSQKDSFIEFFRNLPFTNLIHNINLFESELLEEFNIEKKADRKAVKNILRQIIEVLESQKEEIINYKSDIEVLIKEHEKLTSRYTKEELYTKFKNLHPSEKNKYYKPLKNTFLKMLYECRLHRLSEHLTTVYSNVLGYDENKQILLDTIPDLEGFYSGRTMISNWNKIFYIDPKNNTNPLLGVGIIKSSMRGYNNVGKVLMELRLDIAMKKKKQLEDMKIFEESDEKQRFLMAHSHLRDLLKTRDIKEFENLTVDEILLRMSNATRVSTSNRSVTLYPDTEKAYKDLTDDDFRLMLDKMGIPSKGNLIKNHLPIDTTNFVNDTTLNYIFKNNVEGVNEIFRHENRNPRNLASFLRQKYLEKLYNIQVMEEKNSALRAVLKYFYMADKEYRVPTKHIEMAIDYQLNSLSAIELKAMIEKIDSKVITNTLYSIVPANCNSIININGEEMDIDKFVDYEIDEDIKLGKLVDRVSGLAVREALSWNWSSNPGKQITSIVAVDPVMTHVMTQMTISPQDQHITSLLEGDGVGDDIKPTQPQTPGPWSSPSVAPSQTVKIVNKSNIIFSSSAEYTPFKLSPTEKIIITIDHYKFPTVLHATCYLWFTRETKLGRDMAYKLLLKNKWGNLLTQLRILTGTDQYSTYEKLDEITWKDFEVPLKNEGLNSVIQHLKKTINIVNENTLISVAKLKHEMFDFLLDTPTSGEDPFLSWDNVYNQLIRIMDEKLFHNTHILLEKAHAAKFHNPEMQKLLLLSGGSHLYYGDVDDQVLGIGRNNSGQNLAGKSLMRLREMLRRKSPDMIYTIPPEELDVSILFFETKILMFSNLVKTINNFVKDDDVSLKLVRGILELYKINCVQGENVSFQVGKRLKSIIRSIADSYPGRTKEAWSLMSDYVKVLFGQFVAYSQQQPGIEPNEFSCLFFDPPTTAQEKEDFEVSKGKASELLRNYFKCLFKMFNILETNIIDDMTTDIISLHVARTWFLGHIELRDLSDEQREDIIEGNLNYQDM
tara:strand:+ start:1242 stop:4928 length:3687 start_codon:yes stop_codon:yes gene_type:complete